MARPATEKRPLPPVPETGWQAILHEPVALGLIPLILIRPISDGVTYVTDNFYFTWGIILLFTLWAFRALLRGERIRFAVPLLLLAGYWAVSVASIATTAQFDNTYRGIILWAGHFFLFVLATNAVKTRTAQSIVLATICVSFLLESVWGLIHFKYVLPLVREQVTANPQLFKIYFGDSTPGPELVHRLMVNRAFGSLLFPNSLAAFLILGIPYVFCEAALSLGSMRETVRALCTRTDSPARAWRGIWWGTGAWCLLFSLGYVAVRVGLAQWYPVEPEASRLAFLIKTSAGYGLAESGYLVWWVSLLAIIPALSAVGLFFLLSRHGFSMLGRLIRLFALPVLVVLQGILLWLTFSRGGWLALTLACCSTLALLLYRDHRFASNRKTAMATLLMVMAALIGVSSLALAEAPPEAALPSASLSKDGINLTGNDLANPASFRLRLTYWQTGLNMAWHNPLLGVGLSNYGTVYPQYQAASAGPSKAAHNDYLQALCETGILGFAFFCTFWGYFIYWGARRLRYETDRRERWIQSGLYAGVVAFLIHALVDFNFCNPALCFFALLLAGLFYGRCALNETPPPWKRRRHQLVALGLIVLAPIVTGMALRVYLSDYIVGGRSLFHVKNNFKLNRLFDAGQFFVHDADEAIAQKKGPVKDIKTVIALIPDRTVLQSIGSIRVPDPDAPKQHRALSDDESIPSNAFFVCTKPAQAKEEAIRYFDLWLEELGHADAIFPYNPELACYFLQWYDLLLSNTQDPEEKRHYSVNMLKWAETAASRSPRQFVYCEWLAKAYWLRASLEPGPRRREYFEKGLEQHKRVVELYPSSCKGWNKYGEALIKFGEALMAAGDKAAGEARINEGKRALERADELKRQSAAD